MKKGLLAIGATIILVILATSYSENLAGDEAIKEPAPIEELKPTEEAAKPVVKEKVSKTPTEYALIDEKGIVKTIIVADEDFINSGVVGDPSRWIPANYSVPDKSAEINGKYSELTKEFIAREEVRKHGDRVESVDVVKYQPDVFVATTTP